MWFLATSGLVAQAANQASGNDSIKAKVQVPFKNKIGIRTNVIDWLFTIPNIGLEMEVGQSKYYKNPYTISITGRYNWDTWSRYNPSMVFNVADIRIEGRKYWSTLEDKYLKDSLKTWGRSKYLLKQLGKIDRANPRKERGYYFGFYLGYHNYSFKIGSTGKQGNAFSGGITGGYTIPLYSYRNKRFIDLDLGGSIGLFYSKYDEYRYDAESNCYPITARDKKNLLPWVTEVRVALVYRFESVRNKTLTNKQGRQDRINMLDLKRDSIGKAKSSQMKLRQLRKDSIDAVRKQERMSRDSLKLAKLQQEAFGDSIQASGRKILSIGQFDVLSFEALEDSLKQIAKERKDSIKLAAKQQRKLQKLLERERRDSIKAAQRQQKEFEELPLDSLSGNHEINKAMEGIVESLDDIPGQVELVPDNREKKDADGEAQTSQPGEALTTEDKQEPGKQPDVPPTEEEEPIILIDGINE